MRIFNRNTDDDQAMMLVASDPVLLARRLREIVTALRIICVCGAVITLGIILFIASLRANDAAIVKTRTEARLAECRRDNTRAAEAVESARSQAEVLVETARANGRSAGPAADAAYIAAQESAARDLFPPRACDKASIDAYYESENAR